MASLDEWKRLTEAATEGPWSATVESFVSDAGATEKVLKFLDYVSDHGGGDPRHIDGNGVVVPASLSGCLSCFARDAAASVRAALAATEETK